MNYNTIITICDVLNECIECGLCNSLDISEKNFIYHAVKQDNALYKVLTKDLLCCDIDFCLECGICNGYVPCGDEYCTECGACDNISINSSFTRYQVNVLFQGDVY